MLEEELSVEINFREPWQKPPNYTFSLREDGYVLCKENKPYEEEISLLILGRPNVHACIRAYEQDIIEWEKEIAAFYPFFCKTPIDNFPFDSMVTSFKIGHLKTQSYSRFEDLKSTYPEASYIFFEMGFEELFRNADFEKYLESKRIYRVDNYEGWAIAFIYEQITMDSFERTFKILKEMVLIENDLELKFLGIRKNFFLKKPWERIDALVK